MSFFCTSVAAGHPVVAMIFMLATLPSCIQTSVSTGKNITHSCINMDHTVLSTHSQVSCMLVL